MLLELEVHSQSVRKGKSQVWGGIQWDSAETPERWTETHVHSCCLWCWWKLYPAEGIIELNTHLAKTQKKLKMNPEKVENCRLNSCLVPLRWTSQSAIWVSDKIAACVPSSFQSFERVFSWFALIGNLQKGKFWVI